MSDTTFILIFAGIVAFVWGAFWYSRGFKRGQIGALSSTKVMYLLEEKKDGAKVWRWQGGLNLAKPFEEHEKYTKRKHVVVSFDERDWRRP